MRGKIEKYANGIVYISSLVVLLTVTVFSLLFSFTDENLVVLRDNPIMKLGIILLILMGVMGLNVIVLHLCGKYRKLEGVAIGILISLMGAGAYFLVREIDLLPGSDAMCIYNIAKAFADNQYDAYTSIDSYLALFPFQVRFVFIDEVLMRLTGKTGYLLFLCVNILCYILIFVSGYGIVKLGKNANKSLFPYIALMMTCIPILLYLPSIYGDVPYLAMMMFAVWMLSSAASKANRWRKVIFYVLGISAVVLGLMYKSNMWIFIIAYVLVVIKDFLHTLKKEKILVAMAIVIMSVVIPSVPDIYYGAKTGRDCGRGIPKLGWIAMGMQESNGACGGWNGFHSDVFVASGYSYDITLEKSKASIRESLNRFMNSPQYFFDFYTNKIAIQWAEQEFTTIYPLGFAKNQDSQLINLIENQKEKVLFIMDVHQSFVYVLSLIFALSEVKKQNGKEKRELHYANALILVTVVGGFLFSLIWEAGARTAFPYFVMLFPIGAQGVGYVFELVVGRYKNVADIKKTKCVIR